MKKKFIIATIVMIGMILLVVANVSALTLKLEPSKLNLTGEPNEKICQNLKIEYSVSNGLVEGRDLWAQEGVTDKNLSLHTLDAEDLGLTFDYPKIVKVTGTKDVDICVTAEDKGLYHGALLYRTMQGGSVGIELNVWVTVDIKEEDNNPSQDNNKSSDKKTGGSSSGGGGSFSSDDFINLKNTGAQMTGGMISMNSTSEGDENNKGGSLLIIMPIILLTSLFILITLIGILFVKKSKKRVSSK